MTNTDIENYLVQITKEFKGKRTEKKNFRSDLDDSIACFLDDHPKATLDDIYKHFGTPEVLRTENRKYDIIKKRTKPFRMRHIVILSSCALLVIGGLFLLSREVKDYNGADSSYEIEELRIGNFEENELPGQTPVKIYTNDIK